MPSKRISINRFQGVYCRLGEIRPQINGKPDQCFDISYKDLKGKKIWEKIGWKSEGITAAYAAQIRSERMHNIRVGNENITMQQKKDRLVTLAECAKQYFNWAKNNTKGAAVENNRYDKHIAAPLGNKSLHEITPDDIDNLKNQLIQKNLKPKSIHLILSLIRTIYNKAISLGLYDGSVPTKKRGTFPKVNNRRLRFLSQKEAIKLLTAIKSRSRQLHDEALIALHCGLRFGEIAALTWHDLNFKTEVIQIRNPKNGETRMAFMTPQVKQMFRERHVDWKKRTMTDNDNRESSQEQYLIFPDNKGGIQKDVSRTFERVVTDLGFNKGLDKKDSAQRVVYHSLRHTFASWLALQGTPLYTIKELMGHKNIQMTERYSHLIPDHKKMAIQQMAKAFSQTRSKSKQGGVAKRSKSIA